MIRQTAVPTRTGELSLGQEALWFLQQLAPDSSAYNVSAALNLHSPLDVATLSSAVEQVVTRHRQLNRVFRTAGAKLGRHAGVPAGPVLAVHDLGADDDEAVRAFASDLAKRPFRLDRDRPLRIALLRRAAEPDVLLVAAHHIVMDNVSQLLVFEEILAEYACPGSVRGRDAGADFDEFVRREREFLASPRAAAARDYWRRELADLPQGDDLPTDHPRPAHYTFTGSELDFALPPGLLGEVDAAAAARSTTVFVFLFAAFQLLLHRFGGQDDFVVGSPVTVRTARRYRGSIGYFVNMLPFRVRVDADRPFDGMLRHTGDALVRVLGYREFPYSLIPQLVDVPRDPSRAGLISTMFVMTDDGIDEGTGVSEFFLPQQHGQFDLTLQVHRHGDAARVHLKYNTSLFTADTVRGLACRYTELLGSAVRGDLG